jgi:predicted DNA binding protein
LPAKWPRESTAEDVADLLNTSRPTLHAHLRTAEQELLSTFLDGTERQSSR